MWTYHVWKNSFIALDDWNQIMGCFPPINCCKIYSVPSISHHIPSGNLTWLSKTSHLCRVLALKIVIFQSHGNLYERVSYPKRMPTSLFRWLFKDVILHKLQDFIQKNGTTAFHLLFSTIFPWYFHHIIDQPYQWGFNMANLGNRFTNVRPHHRW